MSTFSFPNSKVWILNKLMNCIAPPRLSPDVTDIGGFRFEKGISPRQSAKWIPMRKYTDELAVDHDQHEMMTLDPRDLKEVRHVEDVDSKQ